MNSDIIPCRNCDMLASQTRQSPTNIFFTEEVYQVHSSIKTLKVIAVISWVSSGILWLSDLFILLFNFLGMWDCYNLVGLLSLVYFPVPIIFEIISLVLSCYIKENKRKFVIINLISVGITVAMTAFVFYVSGKWFW